jgi:hypothetical protein
MKPRQSKAPSSPKPLPRKGHHRAQKSLVMPAERDDIQIYFDRNLFRQEARGLLRSA